MADVGNLCFLNSGPYSDGILGRSSQSTSGPPHAALIASQANITAMFMLRWTSSCAVDCYELTVTVTCHSYFTTRVKSRGNLLHNRILPACNCRLPLAERQVVTRTERNRRGRTVTWTTIVIYRRMVDIPEYRGNRSECSNTTCAGGWLPNSLVNSVRGWPYPNADETPMRLCLPIVTLRRVIQADSRRMIAWEWGWVDDWRELSAHTSTSFHKVPLSLAPIELSHPFFRRFLGLTDPGLVSDYHLAPELSNDNK